MKTKIQLLYTKNKYKNRQDIVRFERGDKQICYDLKKMGYGPKKSFYTRYPDKKFLKSNFNSDFNFFTSNNKTNGIIAKKPTKNLTALKVKGPMSSMPVSWAMNVVPQIRVHNKALNNDAVFDIILIKPLIYKQSFYLNFLLNHY